MNNAYLSRAARVSLSLLIFSAQGLPLRAVAAELSAPAAPMTLPALPLESAASALPEGQASLGLPALSAPAAPVMPEAQAAAVSILAQPQAPAQASARPAAEAEVSSSASFWDGKFGRAVPKVAAVAVTAAAAFWAVHAGQPHALLALPGLMAGMVGGEESAHRNALIERLENRVEAGEVLKAEDAEIIARAHGLPTTAAEEALETLRSRHQLARFSNGTNLALDLDSAAGERTKASTARGLELLRQPSLSAKVRALVPLKAAYLEEAKAEQQSGKAGVSKQLRILYANAAFDAFRALANDDKDPSFMAKKYLKELYVDSNKSLEKPMEFVGKKLSGLAAAFGRRNFINEDEAQDLLRGAALLQTMSQNFLPKPEGREQAPAAAQPPQRLALAAPVSNGQPAFALVSKDDAAYKALHEFGVNLTAQAAAGRLDPMIGRRKELRQILKTMMRRQKNNPVVIGEKGVGKTAVVEGLAQLIVNGSLPADENGPEIKLPAQLAGKNIFRLNLTALVAGTKLRGEFEERVQRVLTEVAASKGKVVLFIDEIHNVLGAGSAEGAGDLSQALLEAMARPGFSLIGATTLDEYRKIEKKGALARRLNPVFLSAPTQKEAVAILKGLKSGYEKQHGVTISDETVAFAVKSAARYITDRSLPDSAIDLIDDAAAEVELKASEDKSAGKTPVTAVTVGDVAKEIALRMDIPAQNVGSDDLAALKALPETLEKRLVGQPEAVKAVVRAVRKGRLGYKDPNQPDSFLFLGPTGVGKTELAKILAKTLFGSEKAMTRIDMSEFMEKHNVARLIGAPPGYVGYDEGGQLTEPVRRRPYQVVLLDEIDKAHPDAFNVLLQVIEDGRLTDGNGRVVDFKNAIIIMTANYLGAHTGSQHGKKRPIGFVTEEDRTPSETKARQAAAEAAQKAAYLEDIKQKLRPEVFNRIGERRVIVFNELKEGHIAQIVDIKEGDLNERLADKHLTVKFSQAAKDYLVADAVSEKNRVYGARPVKQAIEEELVDALAEAELAGQIKNGDSVVVDYDAAAKKWLIATAPAAGK